MTIDFDAYTNEYDGFLGQVQVYVPKGETVGSEAAVLAMLDLNRDARTPTASVPNAASKGQDRYRVYIQTQKISTEIMAQRLVPHIISIRSLQYLVT